MIVHIYGICKQWNNPPWSQTHSHPALEIGFFFLMMFWISLLEGCQISIVGLQDIDLELYKHSHPRAYKALKLCFEGPNVERFLVGRQFLLLFNGFLVSKVAGAGTPNFYIGDWHWSEEASQFFWANSVLLMILLAAFAQLVTQLLAAQKMLGFINLPFHAYYTIVLPCLAIESVGLTHSSYLLKDFLVRIAGIDKSTADPAKQMPKNFFYYARCLLSVAAVIFSFIFIVKGVAMSQTNATEGIGWNKLPGWAAVVVSLFFLYLIACSEGLQVSALALANVPSHEYKKRCPLAYRTTQLLYSGRNMQAFLVGRQFTVAMMIILLSRVTSYAASCFSSSSPESSTPAGCSPGRLMRSLDCQRTHLMATRTSRHQLKESLTARSRWVSHSKRVSAHSTSTSQSASTTWTTHTRCRTSEHISLIPQTQTHTHTHIYIYFHCRVVILNQFCTK